MARVPKRKYGEAVDRLREGGFTMNARTGGFRTSGWMVGGVTSKLLKRPASDVSAEDVRLFHDRNKRAIRKAGNLGGWEDEGTAYVEPARRYPVSTGGFLGASHEMKRRGEAAIYEPASDRTYWNSDQFGGVANVEHPKYSSNRAVHQEWAAQRLQEKFPLTARKAGL